MDLPVCLFNNSNRKVAVHYAIIDSKRIIHFGTSRVCGKKRSKNTIHAEELALKYIHVLTKKKKKNIYKLKILIWRYDKNVEPKDVYCCSSCTKLVKKFNFESDVYTLYKGQFISAIVNNPQPSLGNAMRQSNR